MADKNKLREILAILSPDGTDTDFKAFDEGVDKLKKGLKEKIQAKTLEDVNGQLARVRKSMDLEPLLTEIKNIDKNFDSRIKEVATNLAEERTRYESLSTSEREDTAFRLAESAGAVEALQFELTTLKEQKDKEFNEVRDALAAIPDIQTITGPAFEEIRSRLAALEVPEEAPDLLSPINQRVEEVRTELISRINNHGGNMNRNIAISGNTHVLDRYTDINLKPGAGTLITYAYNDATKYTDITITATGSGSGITRSIQTVAVNTVAGSTPSIDYVYLASGNISITLPTTVGNGNLYTIKNIGAGTITINTTGGETIDGSSNLILPLQFTSVDLISNNSGNWDIT